MKSQLPSPASFLGLPYELRIEIYSYLFEKDSPNPLNPIEISRGWQCCDCSGRALLQASLQLRDETLPIFYKNHNIQFLVGGRHVQDLERWVDHVPDMVLTSIRRFYFVDADYMWAINDCIMSRNVCFEIKGDEVRTQVSEGFIRERWNVSLKLAQRDVGGLFERRSGSLVLTREKLREMIAMFA